jgi:triacylglycerol lipase
MNFSVWPPEVNSGLLVDGPGSAPMLEAAAAWDGIGTELSSAANAFSSVISDLAAEAWQGPSSASMTNAITPYVGWLGKAAAQAEQSAAQARAAASAYEAALATVVDPASIATNRSQLLSLVRSNLFGQNAPSIAAAEAAYEQMWAHDVAVMSGYHAGASATVAQLGQWEQALEHLTGLSGQSAKAIADAAALVPQEVRQTATAASTAANGFVNTIVIDIFGTGPSLPVPATLNPAFVGAPSLPNRVEVAGLWVVKDFVEPFIDNQLANTSSPLLALFANPIPPVKLFISNTPPKFLPLLFSETVQQTTYDGMSVVQITPAHPDGNYVVAMHGGAFIFPPSIFHWFDYAHMAYQTGATIEVPIYPLLQQGGTAGVVVPEMAGLIESEIAAHGASNVSVYGDSAGGNLALAAAEYLVANNEAVPASMVLLSPWLNVALNNPNIGFVHDPLLPVGPGQQIGKEWAGGLPETNYEVSPLYGSLNGLPQTYVYSGSLDSLGPDVVLLDQEAATQGAPFNFVLRTGDIHDWILLSPDGFGYLPQIEQELGI